MKKLLIVALFLTGCTDAGWKNVTTLGSTGTINCYSGNTLIYSGTSTGKIQTVDKSDGWEFEDAKTHKFMRISGACVIEN